MSVVVSQFLRAGVLMVWGALLSYFYFSGRINSYLHPSFHIFTVVAGIALIVLAGCVLFGGTDAACCTAPGCFHGGTTPKAVVLQIFGVLVLVVPLLLAAAASTDSFGATAINNRQMVDSAAGLPGYQPSGRTSSAPVEPPLPTDSNAGPAPAANAGASPAGDNPYVPKNAAGQIQAQTVDLLYAAEDASMRTDFENKTVEMIGQYMPARTNNAGGNRFDLVRMFIVCCAADARPVAVTVQMPKAEKLPEMGWVRVTGKATFPMEGGHRVPVVVADTVKATDPPQDTFIY